MINKWDHRFMEMTQLIAGWSKDPSTKVGCVVIEPDTRTVVATGYNGLPRGIDDSSERLDSREYRYHVTAHAELNAIYAAARFGTSLAGCHLYSTWVPCSGHHEAQFPSCASAIIQVGIRRVVVPTFDVPGRWQKSMDFTRGLFAEARVVIEGLR